MKQVALSSEFSGDLNVANSSNHNNYKTGPGWDHSDLEKRKLGSPILIDREDIRPNGLLPDRYNRRLLRRPHRDESITYVSIAMGCTTFYIGALR